MAKLSPHPPAPSPNLGEGEPDSEPLSLGRGAPEVFQSPSPSLGEGFRVRAKLRLRRSFRSTEGAFAKPCPKTHFPTGNYTNTQTGRFMGLNNLIG
jgi:hypothetical protein